MSGSSTRHPRLLAALVFAGLFVAYNANGREVGGSDSQPTKLGARALVLRGTLRLDDDVRAQPLLAERVSLAKDREGHYRSAYSPAGSLVGAVTALGLRLAGADLDAPRAPNLIAKLTASATAAAAVALVFLALLRLATVRSALLVAIGLGLGTNFWAVFSQTLAQHHLVALGTALAFYTWTRPSGTLRSGDLWWGALGLGLSATARLQTAPLVGLLGVGLIWRVGWRRAVPPLLLPAAMTAALCAVQWYWFGHPLGAMPQLEALHPSVHGLTGSVSRAPWVGAAGLLVSPSRGLLIFSPVVIVALLGIPRALRRFPDLGLGWGLLASLLLAAGYSTYSVWWGGHTYGPRYLLDGIVWLTAPAAVALDDAVRARWGRTLAAIALAWSITVAGTGAFFMDDWNTSPTEIDLDHARLWDWHDPQMVRAWRNGPSPQNFNLFNGTSIRRTGPELPR